MKLILHLGMFLLLSLPVLADITVSTDKQTYNLGDQILVSYTVTTDSDFAGLTELSLFCGDFQLKFYTLPTNLFAGQSQDVGVPGLGVVSIMEGLCSLSADVSSFDNVIDFSATSNSFSITPNLPVSVTLEQDTLSPASELTLAGIVGKSHSSRSTVELSFLDNVYTGPVVNNSFAFKIIMPSDISTGQHTLNFVVNDSFDNSGTASALFSIQAVPTLLTIDVAEGLFKPGETIEVVVNLTDQAGAVMSEEVDFSLHNNEGTVILLTTDITPVTLKLELAQSLPPGTYTARASSAGINATSILVVEPVEELSVSFDNRTLTIVNSGNVDYAKELVINLSGTSRTIILSKDIELEPGQEILVDLYVEVPEDDYQITFPELTDASEFDAHLEDERSALRKTGDFVGITGRLVTDTGMPGIQTILSPVILIVVIFLLIFFFSRNRGKGSSGDSEYAAEVAALEKYTEKQHDKQEEEAVHPEHGPELSRDDESVRKFMENLNKDKPFK